MKNTLHSPRRKIACLSEQLRYSLFRLLFQRMAVPRDFNQRFMGNISVPIRRKRPLRGEMQDMQQSNERESTEECLAS